MDSVDSFVERLYFLAGFSTRKPESIIDIIERVLGPDAVRFGRDARLHNAGSAGWVLLIPKSLEGERLIQTLATLLAEWLVGHLRSDRPSVEALARAILLPTPFVELVAREGSVDVRELAEDYGLPVSVVAARFAALPHRADRSTPIPFSQPLPSV